MIQASQALYSDSPCVDLTEPAVYPYLSNCEESLAPIIPHIATGTWAKVLETDFKNNAIKQGGQLASMDPCKIRTLRGVRPNKVETVKCALKAFHLKLLKEGKAMLEEKKEKAKAPVEEVTSPEDEEKIKEDLFLRLSPSPIDLNFSEMDTGYSSPVTGIEYS